MSLINLNKLVIVNLNPNLASQNTLIEVSFPVKQINILGSMHSDNTGPYARNIHCLHSSLFNHDCIGFINNSAAPVQFGNDNIIRYYYETPIAVSGMHSFYFKDCLGAYVPPTGSPNLVYLSLEFISDNNDIVNLA